MGKLLIIPVQLIETKILLIRGQKGNIRKRFS